MAPFEKPPRSIAEHIDILQERGMAIPDVDFAKNFLSFVTYYRLCSYWLPFEKDHATHEFLPNTSFEDVARHYEFDRALRLLLMDAIERIEISIRTSWVNVLKFSHGPHAHLNPEAFHVQKDKHKSISWSQHQGAAYLIADHTRSRETHVKHFRQKYDEALPPIWAAAELMTLGAFSRWYANTKTRRLRNEVAAPYDLDEKVLTSFLHHLNTVRNYCAHHTRVWNRSFTIRWILPKSKPKHLVQSLHHPVAGCATGMREPYKLYNTVTMISHLMNTISPATNWQLRLIEIIDTHNINSSDMGFPNDYATLPIWKNSV